MLQRHSCWPWDGPTLQVPQPGQVPSAPAGFVPFLMSLLYLSYIHSVTTSPVPTDPPNPPLTAKATETNASSQQLCVYHQLRAPPGASMSHTHHFHSMLCFLNVLHPTFAATAQVVSLGSPWLMICTNSSETLCPFSSPIIGPASNF